MSWTKISSMAYACIIRDITAEFNVLSKLMQRRGVEGYQIVDGIEQLEDFLDSSVLSFESHNFSEVKIKNLQSMEVLLKQRLKIDPKTQKVFLVKDKDDRSSALGNFPKSKKCEESDQIDIEMDGNDE